MAATAAAKRIRLVRRFMCCDLRVTSVGTDRWSMPLKSAFSERRRDRRSTHVLVHVHAHRDPTRHPAPPRGRALAPPRAPARARAARRRRVRGRLPRRRRRSSRWLAAGRPRLRAGPRRRRWSLAYVLVGGAEFPTGAGLRGAHADRVGPDAAAAADADGAAAGRARARASPRPWTRSGDACARPRSCSPWPTLVYALAPALVLVARRRADARLGRLADLPRRARPPVRRLRRRRVLHGRVLGVPRRARPG